jgi:hypothetical protein
MKTSTVRRLDAIEARLAESHGRHASEPLLAWLATPDSRAVLEAAARGDAYTLPDDVRRAGLAMQRALTRRLASATIDALSRVELAALVAAGASSP